MIELNEVEFGTCLGLTAGVFGFAAYWYMRFFRVLPLERGARRARDLRDFTIEVLDLGPAAKTPQALNELGRRILDFLHHRAPQAHLWWVSGNGVVGEGVLSHRGPGPDTPPPRLLAEGMAEVMAQDRILDLENGAVVPKTIRRIVAGKGVRRLRLISWGRWGGCGGALGVGETDASPDAIADLEAFLDISRSQANLIAAAVEDFRALAKSRDTLQGGLSDTIDHLTQTHSRLIERAREIRALEEVATTLSAHGGQSQSALSAIVAIVARFLDADLVAFLLLDESRGELVVQPGSYGLQGEEMLYRIPLTEGNSSSARAFHSGEAYLTGDAQNDPNVISRYARLWKIHSLMVVPLVVEGRSLGVIRVGSKRTGVYSKEHLAVLQVIAREAAVIVETAVLNRTLSQTTEQLIGLNRMKDDFVSTVSHEFKTPLTTIMGFITVLLEGETGTLTDQQNKFLNIARTAAKRLAGLVSDLLDLSRLEGGVKMEMQRQSLAGILRAGLETHRHQAAEARKDFDVEIPDDLPEVVGDDRWLQLVIDNLVSNAVKFTRPGGRIQVSALDKGEFVMVCVGDDGIGIPPEERDRVFEKFYRASNRGEVAAPGTGLGLAIVREVVSKHGGKVWVESEIGRGSRFFFVLRAAPREAAS